MKRLVRIVAKTVDELCPFDDIFTQVFAEDRGCCEELLQVVIDNLKSAEYMKRLKSENVGYNEKFLCTNSAERYYKLGEGRITMCKAVEEIANSKETVSV